MKLKSALLLFLSIPLFCSCQEQKQESSVIKVDVAAAKELDLNELVEEINIIPLETNDSCLVEDRFTMQVRNGAVYITNGLKEVLKFDAEGKFMRSTLSKNGQNADEYVIAYSTYVDRDDNLGIYEMYLPRIQKYNKDFGYMETLPVEVPNTLSPLRARTHVKLNDSIYAFKDIFDIHFYSVTQKQVVKTLHEEFPGLLGWTTHLMLVDYDDKWHYSRSYSCDTLFYLDEKELELKPELVFDFGGKSFNVNDLPSNMSAEYYQKIIVETDKYLVLEKINLSDKKFCIFIGSDNSYVSYTTKKGSKVYRINKQNPFPVPDAIEHNMFYNLVWPVDLKERIKTELLDKESLKRLPQIKEEDNPVLIRYKLK